jgi:holo-[acyl-carrier protein] synthase
MTICRRLVLEEDIEWGVGVDIESVARLRRALRVSRGFARRTFSKREIRYCMSKGDPAVHFAGVFAAKEAAYKAANGLLKGKVDITSFEILHDGRGVPVVRHDIGGKRGSLFEIRISVSHTSEYAVALAIARLRMKQSR